MISPHARGMAELMPYFAARYVAVGFVAGVAAGAAAAAAVWLAVG